MSNVETEAKVEPSLARDLYEKETKAYLGTFDKCWMDHCDGQVLPCKPEPFEVDGIHYLRVMKCQKCGQGWSIWPFKEWIRIKRSGAKKTIHEAKEHREDARLNYRRAVNVAKRELEESLARIEKRVAEARATLRDVKA